MTELSEIDENEITEKSGYHHGDLRAQLLNAVRLLVEEKGAENFSIAEAARKAGVSSAAPYRHFKDKPQILKALVLETMGGMATRMQEAIAPYPIGSIERINALGACYIGFAREHPGMFRLVFGISESHDGDEDLSGRGQQVFGIVIKAVADYLGVEAESEEATRRAYMLWTVVHGHSWLTIDGKAKMKGIEVDETQFLSDISEGLIVSMRNQT